MSMMGQGDEAREEGEVGPDDDRSNDVPSQQHARSPNDEQGISVSAQERDFGNGTGGQGSQLRLVKLTSDILPAQQRVAIIDAHSHADGVSIGRDRIYTPRIRLPAMEVSKHHANIFPLPSRQGQYTFAITDTGSTHGTHLMPSPPDSLDPLPPLSAYERLSAPKQASKPRLLRHMGLLRTGETVFQIHQHGASRWASSCEGCSLSQDGSSEIPLLAPSRKSDQGPTQLTESNTSKYASERGLGDRKLNSEMARRQAMEELRRSHLGGTASAVKAPNADHHAPNYVDRAAVRRDRLGWGGGSSSPRPDVEVRPPSAAKQTQRAPSAPASQRTAQLDADSRGFRMFAAMFSSSSDDFNPDQPAYVPTSDPVMARGTDGRAGLGSKRLLDVEEIAHRAQKQFEQADYTPEGMRDRQRRRYEEASR